MALSLCTLVRVTMVIALLCVFKMAPASCGTVTLDVTADVNMNLTVISGGKQIMKDVPINNENDLQSNVKTSPTRLPEDLDPLEYFLTIEPKMYEGSEKNFTFSGTVKLLFHCLNSTNKLVMHSNKLEESNIVVKPANDTDGVAPMGFEKAYNDKNHFLTLNMIQSFVQGRNYTVSMDFKGPLTRITSGFYFSSYKNETGKNVYLAYTKMMPTGARRAFPCMDEPHLKAFFTISVIRRSPYGALSNMPLEKSTSLGDERVQDTFQRTPKMSTYLVAFVVSDYKNKSKLSSNGTLNEVWSQPSKINQTDFALNFSARCCDFLEDFFQISYPLSKQSNVAVPVHPGVMENWGLIIYKENYLLYKEGVSSAINKKWIAVMIAHEWATMWFGNLVTLRWWDDLWLNKGFASFMQYFIVDRLLPDWKLMDSFVVSSMQWALDRDAKFASHPLYENVKTAAEALQIFDLISYNKGSSIVRMISSVLGEELFRKCLTIYINKFKYKTANHSDLWTVFNEQAQADGLDIDLVEVMNTWTLQMNYPVVNVTVNGGLMTLTQERYIVNPEAKDPGKYSSEYGYRWFIPFTYITGQNATKPTIQWMKPNDTKTNITILLEDDDWVLCNVNVTGYYRTNYDADNWNKLSRQLHENHTVIGPANRAQLINDAFYLARRGYLAQNTTLDIVDYVSNETEYTPWYSAAGVMYYMSRVLHSTDASSLFKEFVANKTGQTYEKLSPRSEQDDLELVSLRETIERLACMSNFQPCITAAMDHFRSLKNNDSENNQIPRMARTNVYCTAMEQCEAQDWDFLYERYVSETDVSEKERLKAGLTCSSKPALLEKLLNRTLTSKDIPKKDGLGIMVMVAGNVIGNGTFVAFDFVKNSWTKISKKYGVSSFHIKTLIETNFGTFSSRQDLENLKAFEQSLPEKHRSALKHKFQVAKESILNSIKWVENYKVPVKMWLQAKGYGQ